MISQAAIDLIVREEVSSQTYYTRHYQHPEWPGGASGITIAIGYDLGYASVSKIRQDWAALVSPAMLEVMCQCSGFKGSAAKALLPRVRSQITIPWDAAMQVFLSRDIPQWTTATFNALPNCGKLSPTCQGVLVSLGYNRGCGGYAMSGDRYLEMRAIKAAMTDQRFADIPGLLDHMARLWPGSGVAGRRHREAALFRKGLTEPVISGTAPTTTVDSTVVNDTKADQPARTPQPATSTTQHGAAGGIVVVATGAAAVAGLTWYQIFEVGLAAAVIAMAVWGLIYIYRNPPPD